MRPTERAAAGPPWLLPAAIATTLVLLAARNPWALLRPQLCAEDGSVFLVQHDQLGAGAILQPYQGYLHLLPRIVAWLTGRLFDVAAWPLGYNLGALVVTTALLLRFASPRVVLPGRPWLVLALAFVVHTGEVWLNITNLQWLAAFFLLLQLGMTPPTSTTGRVGDLLIALAVSLTGPFSLLLWPLFVWRWYRSRDRDTALVLLAVSAGAAIQTWLLVTHPAPAEVTGPIRPLMLSAVLGSRLVAWPWLGPTVAQALPLPGLAALGAVALGIGVGWIARPDPRRELRLMMLFAAIVLAASGAWRARADTWETANLTNGDRYFFIPRVLVLWLVIWEFDAKPRAVAWLAQAAWLLTIFQELPQHIPPAPRNYHWADHCDAIRQGRPANIPTLPEGWTLEYPGRSHPR